MPFDHEKLDVYKIISMLSRMTEKAEGMLHEDIAPYDSIDPA